jgi:2,5-diketo-D-gluconate reductase B
MSDEQNRVLVTEGDTSPHPLAGGVPARFGDQPVVATANGLQMPKLGLGTYQLMGDECRDVVAAALELGVRHIDTAQSYGNEAAVGAGLESSGVARDDVFVTTKIDDDRHSPADLVRSVEESLARLGTDHVDLLLVHWPVEWDIIAATLQTLAQVQASGMAHHIGVSNFTVEQLESVQSFAPLEVLQVECHPFFQQRELRSWCARADWIFTAYTPLAKGAVADDDTLRDIASAHSTSPATVALAWLVAQDHVVAIPRTRSQSHLEANWAALSLRLSSEELRRIDELDVGRRLVNPAHAPW